jgi:hypothetical protein
MFRQMINLTELEINREIESVLEHYAEYPYQQAFAAPDLRQELIAYVLNRVSSYYTVIEPDRDSAVEALRSNSSSLQVESCREAVIHQGIQHIFCTKAEQIQHHLPEETDSSRAASHWFG